jgi:diguanylate cyclase (GGDEF)-like protein
MADSTPSGHESGASGTSRGGGARDGGGGGRGGVPPAQVDRWLESWRQRLEGDPRLPEEEARLVVEAVLSNVAASYPESLERAGRAWGRAHRSVSAMVGRLSSFREALAAGGVDDPLRMHRALDQITASATEEVLNRLERASRTDALTGVGNRRAFDETLSAALSAASRQGHDVTVVAVDLDGLKRINDTEGHAAGDAALLDLVRAFYSGLRDEDTVFRVGGDEFVILLPFTSVDAAGVLMERIQDSAAPAFTWGAAGFPSDGADARVLVEAADQEMLRRRDEDRRAVVIGARRTAFGDAGQRAWELRRWAWVPAAAVVVLVAALLAAFLSSSPPRHSVSAGRGPGHGASGPPPATGVNGGSQQPSSSGSGRRPVTAASGGGAPAVTGYTSPLPGAPGSPGGSTTPPGTSPTPPGSPAPPGGQGGLFGALEQLLSPVPLVGGPNGLLSTVGGVLTGPSNVSTGTTSASTGSSPAITATTVVPAPTTAGPLSTGSGSGLLGAVTHLLG